MKLIQISASNKILIFKMFKSRLSLFLYLPILMVISSSAWADKAFTNKLIDSGMKQTEQHIQYDPRYFNIPYPNGDVPQGSGVCSDVIIRAYRAGGIDLQKLVHEDMKKHFNLYPKLWGLQSTDTNIDHRRVPNLQVFFKRFGVSLPLTNNPADYEPGDIVTWNLNKHGSLPHIGLVSDTPLTGGRGYKMIHNIGRGVELEDMLFDYKITGHYRYNP